MLRPSTEAAEAVAATTNERTTTDSQRMEPPSLTSRRGGYPAHRTPVRPPRRGRFFDRHGHGRSEDRPLRRTGRRPTSVFDAAGIVVACRRSHDRVDALLHLAEARVVLELPVDGHHPDLLLGSRWSAAFQDAVGVAQHVAPPVRAPAVDINKAVLVRQRPV